MNMSEFIKPTKIIIVIVLLVLIFLFLGLAGVFSVSCPLVVGIKCTQPLVVRVLNGIADFLMLPQFLVNDTTLYKLGVQNSTVSFVIFLVIDIIYLYLLTATIVFITNTIRKISTTN